MKMNLRKHPELVPLVEWWEKDGKSTVAIVVVAAAVFGAWRYYKYYNASAEAEAAKSLAEAYAPEELEEGVAKFGSRAAGGLMKVKLAKAYFQAERYEEALAIYEELEKAPPAGFEDVPPVGKAQCLEALEKYDEALAAFEAFASFHETSYLRITAQLGAARCVCEKGDKAKALEMLAALKKEVGDDEISKARVDAAEDLVKRYVKHEKRSLFDAADAAAKSIEKENAEKAEAKPAPEVKAEVKKEAAPEAKKDEPAKKDAAEGKKPDAEKK